MAYLWKSLHLSNPLALCCGSEPAHITPGDERVGSRAEWVHVLQEPPVGRRALGGRVRWADVPASRTGHWVVRYRNGVQARGEAGDDSVPDEPSTSRRRGLGAVRRHPHYAPDSTNVIPSHVEGHSTVFGTALNYAAIRILGMDAEHPVCVKARATLHKLGSCSWLRWLHDLILC